MLWSMVMLLGLGIAFLYFSKMSVGRDIVSSANSPLIRKEMNSLSGVVAEVVQYFATGDIIRANSNVLIAFCANTVET